MHRILLAIVLVASTAIAQEFRAFILGSVTDPTGAAAPNARVTVTNTATGAQSATQTGTEGQFVVPQLPPGAYELTVQAEGFRTFTRRGILLAVADRANIEVRLELGSTVESVTVTAELTGIESNQSATGQLMDTKSISELPINGRSFLSLLQLSTGVVFTVRQFGLAGWSGVRQWESGPAAGEFSMQGSRPRTNAFLVDGAPQGVEGGVSLIPLVDAVEAFKVATPATDASQGLTGGGVVNLTMKSGTNELHGLLSHFLRNNIFDANYNQQNRAIAQNPKVASQQHQWNTFAALLSGPIIKNRLFFSANYDGFRERSPKPVTQTVPTLEQRAGDYSNTRTSAGQLVTVHDPLTTRQSGSSYLRDAFAGNRIPASRMNPVGLNILKYIPAPNFVSDPVTNFNNYVSTPNPSRYGYDAGYIKVDYLWNERHRTFVSHSVNSGYSFARTNGFPEDLPTALIGSLIRSNQAPTVDHIWTIDPRTVLTGRLSGSRWIQESVQDHVDRFDGAQLGFKGPFGANPTPRFPYLTFTDYATMGPNATYVHPSEVYSGVFDLSRTAGRHFLRTGVRIGQTRYSRNNNGNYNGLLAFTKAFTQRDGLRAETTSGNAMAALLLGYPSSGGTDLNAFSTYGNKFFGLYVQDDLRLNKRLMLNFGLRWDVQTPSVERFDRMVTGFNPAATYALGAAQAKGAVLYAGSGGRQAWSANWRDFQPRLGLAYQVNRVTVLRSSYGITYMPINAPGVLSGIYQNGFSRRTPYVATLGGGLNAYIPGQPGASTMEVPFSAGLLQPAGTSAGLKALVAQSINYQNPEFIVPHVHQFSAGLDLTLPWATTVEASYAGSRTANLSVSRSMNAISLDDRLRGFADPTYLTAAAPNPYAGAPELAGTGYAAATLARSTMLRPYPQFSDIIMDAMNVGDTVYDALQVRLNKRVSHGLMTRVDYTFSKTLERTAFLEPQYTTPVRDLAAFDRTNHLSLFVLYELPVGRGKALGRNWNRALDLALGNWQWNGMYEYMNGPTLTMPAANATGNAELPEGQQSFSRWFNTCTILSTGNRSGCASASETPVWVQLKPNELRVSSQRFPNLRGHWQPAINMSLFKTFPIRERIRLEFRAEAFNVVNNRVYDSPNVSLTSAQFGVVTLDQVNFPRNMQFALRLLF